LLFTVRTWSSGRYSMKGKVAGKERWLGR